METVFRKGKNLLIFRNEEVGKRGREVRREEKGRKERKGGNCFKKEKIRSSDPCLLSHPVSSLSI